jgi:Tfp pilus assembly protein PilO
MKKVYEPQEKVLKKTVEELNKVVGEINSIKTVPPLASVKSQLKKHERELAIVKARLEKTTVQTGTPREVNMFLARIIDMMEYSGITIHTIVPKAIETDERYGDWHPFEVDFSGSYYGFIRLLMELKEKPDAVKVEKIEITRKDGELLRIKMILKI